MKTLICNALAIKKGYNSSPQLSGKDSVSVYLKNIFVSLKSAKINNPESEVVLFTNSVLSEEYLNLFNKNGIICKKIEFDKFVFPERFNWSLAFFKLNALMYATQYFSDYDKILLLDTDTIITASLNDLWSELDEDGICLANVGDCYSRKDRVLIRNAHAQLYEQNGNINHYGGELIAGNLKALKQYLVICEDVYERIRKSDFSVDTSVGDELVESIAAYYYKNIIESDAYLFRFWTGRWYLCSTKYINDPVCIWHLPTEKEYGMLEVFKYLSKFDNMPDIKWLAKTCGLPANKRKIDLIYIKRIISVLISKGISKVN